jgi:tetratricopeptide (TPR) repeat protein
MKRKSSRQYVIQAHARQAQQFDFEKGDTVAFLKKFNKLLKDRENRPFLDVLNHQMGLFYDKNNKYDIAQKFYNKSLKSRSEDAYLTASNYRNLANLYFNKAKYKTAGHYFDSTLVQLNVRSKEYRSIKKKRENLVEVIKFEGIATRNDSILNVVSLSEADRVGFYEKHITKLKKEDEIKKALLEKEKKKAQASGGKEAGGQVGDNASDLVPSGKQSMMPPGGANGLIDPKQSDFYFYNQTTVAFGKTEFRKNWGERTHKNNWRLSAAKADAETKDVVEGTDNPEAEAIEKVDKENEKYVASYYLKQLPTKQTAIDSIAKERNFAYYQLGVIYKEKFKEYQLAASKLEQLLKNNPEERLVLPSMYNLYKIYEIIDKNKALAMKDSIVSQYPDSRYAQILNNANSEEHLLKDSPEAVYNKWYKLYEAGDYRTVYANVEVAVNQYIGEEIVSKFELFKANIVGKLKGLGEYKKALNFVALNYPFSDEGKQTEILLGKNIPSLENLKFNAEKPKSWKLLYKVDYKDEKNNKTLLDKINKFIASRPFDKLTVSNDVYTMEENFIVIHGIISEEYAKGGITTILKEYKDYKITQTPIVISNYNYKVLQIKKNLAEYLAPAPAVQAVQVPTTDVVPVPVPVEVPAKKPTVIPVLGQDATLPPVLNEDLTPDVTPSNPISKQKK